MYRSFIRPLLFLLDAEMAHESTVKGLGKIGTSPFMRRWMEKTYALPDPRLKTSLLGLEFPNPLGIAAGLDKNAIAYEGFGAMGLGSIEIGTVTPKPQSGNPKPRLFRLPEDRALLNRMGFNNDGMEAIAERLRERKARPLIGANIGKNRDTSNAEASEDCARCLRVLHPFADYAVINVSSPNTPGLRELQEKDALRKLLSRVLEERERFSEPKPLLLKLSPDLEQEALDEMLSIVQEMRVDGLIATNTSIVRSGLRTSPKKLEGYGDGGISGAPLSDRSNELISYLKKGTDGELPVIGVGGIFSEADALAKLDAGADLLQLYSGLIYQGPGLVKRILRAILERRIGTERTEPI